MSLKIKNFLPKKFDYLKKYEKKYIKKKIMKNCSKNIFPQKILQTVIKPICLIKIIFSIKKFFANYILN